VRVAAIGGVIAWGLLAGGVGGIGLGRASADVVPGGDARDGGSTGLAGAHPGTEQPTRRSGPDSTADDPDGPAGPAKRDPDPKDPDSAHGHHTGTWPKGGDWPEHGDWPGGRPPREPGDPDWPCHGGGDPDPGGGYGSPGAGGGGGGGSGGGVVSRPAWPTSPYPSQPPTVAEPAEPELTELTDEPAAALGGGGAFDAPGVGAAPVPVGLPIFLAPPAPNALIETVPPPSMSSPLPSSPAALPGQQPSVGLPIPISTAIGAAPPAGFRVGYAPYLRTADTSEIAGLAVPGVAGIVALTAIGGFVGYRQAKSGVAVRTAGTSKFLR
jgi:hypothetical protein